MRQLKISDLSVGDWVEWIGERCKVDLPLLNTVFPHAKIYPAYTSATLQPIPITPEILKKNGFAFLPDNNPRYLRFVDGNIVISTYEGRETFALYCYNDMGWTETFSQTLRYIHQLQHALRLSGIEKEIEL